MLNMKTMHSLRPIESRKLASISIWIFIIILPACNGRPSELATSDALSTTNDVAVKAPVGKRIELALTGYNYTDRYIDQFEVDGQGGGNIAVSGPNTAGNGSSCCVSYRSGGGAVESKGSVASGRVYFQRSRSSSGPENSRPSTLL